MIPCAVILAGGFGTRLQPVIGAQPKILAPVVGRPFIYYLLEQLEETGIKLTVLCTGFGAEKVRNEIGDWFGDMKIVYSEESKPLGTAGALRNALPYFNTDSVLVLNGDSFCPVDLVSFISGFAKKKAGVGLLVAKAAEAQAFGQLQWEKKGPLTSFAEKSPHPVSAWVNAGIYLFKKSLLYVIPPDRKLSLEENFFPFWAEEQKLWPFPVDHSFIDIGTPESYARAQEFFKAESFV